MALLSIDLKWFTLAHLDKTWYEVSSVWAQSNLWCILYNVRIYLLLLWAMWTHLTKFTKQYEISPKYILPEIKLKHKWKKIFQKILRWFKLISVYTPRLLDNAISIKPIIYITEIV